LSFIHGPAARCQVLAPFMRSADVREDIFQTNARALETAVLATVLVTCPRLWHEHLTTRLVRGGGEAPRTPVDNWGFGSPDGALRPKPPDAEPRIRRRSAS
jgi:hypothetical protein